jgi:hypothetical protein
MRSTTASANMQLMLEAVAGRKPAPRSVPVSWIVQNLGGGLPEDRAECPTTLFGNKPLAGERCPTIPSQPDLWNCKGALGKTSGRSIFRNAPLRATSSDLERSSSAAIRKTLRAHIPSNRQQVAFARFRKTLLAGSNNRCIRD